MRDRTRQDRQSASSAGVGGLSRAEAAQHMSEHLVSLRKIARWLDDDLLAHLLEAAAIAASQAADREGKLSS